MRLVAKRDEWSDLDYLLAKRTLEERSVTLEVGELAHMEEQRLKELGNLKKLIQDGFMLAFICTIWWYIWNNYGMVYFNKYQNTT